MAGTKEGDSKREENRRKEGSLKMATKQKKFPSVFIVRHLPCKDLHQYKEKSLNHFLTMIAQMGRKKTKRLSFLLILPLRLKNLRQACQLDRFITHIHPPPTLSHIRP